MQRILDVDVDFFLDEIATWRGQGDNRLDAEEFPPWRSDQVLSFLSERCGLRGPLPGFVVTNHGELFGLWREAILGGVLEPPFHVTHVDAHADLGLGDAGYMYLCGELLFKAPGKRQFPDEGDAGLGDGNYLAFAIANRWLSDLLYVYPRNGGGDLFPYFMPEWDSDAPYIQLPRLTKDEIRDLVWSREPPTIPPDRLEPPVPFRRVEGSEFHTQGRFDFICIAQSPPFTPPEADALFEMITERFVERPPAG